ncbi:hypothetical protein FRC15_001206 [Serendipita sp. 397]|nr:hypothetical protein FRC15_001206 [Serendipita sp. 397]
MSTSSKNHPARQTADSLEETRARLLLEIAEMQRNRSIEPTEAQISRISQLKEEHNSLVDNYNQVADVHTTDPSRRLPNEIFINILSKAIQDTWAADWIPDLLVFTLVSMRWQKILVSSPGLWKVIAVREDDMLMEAKLSVALHLSGSAPLFLRLQPPLRNWKEIVSSLLPHRDRITEVTLDLDKEDRFRLHGRIPDILEEFGHLPALRQLHCINVRFKTKYISDVVRFIERNPQLNEISGVWLNEALLRSPHSRNITSFYTKLEAPSLFRRLRPMVKLRRLAFQSYGQRVTNQEDVDRANIPESLLKCVYYRQIGSIFMPLLSRTAATLVTLDLHATLSESARIFQILDDFRVLKSLVLSLEIQANGDTLVPPPRARQQRQSSLHSAQFTIFNQGWPSPNPDTWGPPFTLMVRRFLPHLKEIFVSANALYLPWTLVEAGQFDALEALDLHFPHDASPPPPTFRLPPTLRRCHLAPNRAFDVFHSDCVTSLTVVPVNLSEAPIDLNARSWPALIDLSISASALSCNDGSFEHLQSLHLDVVYDDDWDYSTRFCRDLALNLECMPMLKDLSFRELPEWDIFFILLERYNFRTKIGSTRISSISFSGDVPTFLWDPIRGLCDGKFVNRPPNLELCWVDSIDIIYDRTLPGCMACIKAQLYCPSPWIANVSLPKTYHRPRGSDASSTSDQDIDISMEMRLHDIDDPLELEIPIPTYPDTSDEILSTWEIREDTWQLLKKRIRYAKCSNHEGSQFLVMNGRVTISNKSTRPWFLPSDDQF